LDFEVAQPGGPTARVSVLPFLPEDGRRSSFRNVIILLKYRRWTKSNKQLLQITQRIIWESKMQPFSNTFSTVIELVGRRVIKSSSKNTPTLKLLVGRDK
jgi:hypothetical protein